jgi:hypothetical protein
MEGWTRGNYFLGFLKYPDSGRSFEERPLPAAQQLTCF